MTNVVKSVSINGQVVPFGGGGAEVSAEDVSYDNTTSGMTADNVQDAIEEVFQSVSNGKELIADAITDMGVQTSATDSFSTMATNINNIGGGIDIINKNKFFAVDKIDFLYTDYPYVKEKLFDTVYNNDYYLYFIGSISSSDSGYLYVVKKHNFDVTMETAIQVTSDTYIYKTLYFKAGIVNSQLIIEMIISNDSGRTGANLEYIHNHSGTFTKNNKQHYSDSFEAFEDYYNSISSDLLITQENEIISSNFATISTDSTYNCFELQIL